MGLGHQRIPWRHHLGCGMWMVHGNALHCGNGPLKHHINEKKQKNIVNWLKPKKSKKYTVIDTAKSIFVSSCSLIPICSIQHQTMLLLNCPKATWMGLDSPSLIWWVIGTTLNTFGMRPKLYTKPLKSFYHGFVWTGTLFWQSEVPSVSELLLKKYYKVIWRNIVMSQFKLPADLLEIK